MIESMSYKNDLFSEKDFQIEEKFWTHFTNV